MKTINYTLKNSKANTQYVDISKEDYEYITNWIQYFLSHVVEEATYNQLLRDYLFEIDRDNFPKNKRGGNSIFSFAGGILNQKLKNPNKNLALSQLEGIEYLFTKLDDLYEGQAPIGKLGKVEPINFKEVQNFFQVKSHPVF